MRDFDALVIGAGPYGLSAAAYLRSIKGLEVRAFGEPMSFWERNMPLGMLLRSGWQASHISDPEQSLTLDLFKQVARDNIATPVPLDRFIRYGKWYQNQAVSDLDRREIAIIDRNHKGLKVIAKDGETLHAQRVFVAVGIAPFAWTPLEFRNLPCELASHSSNHRDFGIFKDRKVVVVGGGQSALESAALLSERGAIVEVFVRESHIHWLGWQKRIKRAVPMGRFLYADTDVGPAGISQLVARPRWFRKLPRFTQDKIARRCIRPAGADWLRKRLANVPIRLGCFIRSAVPHGEQLTLLLNDGSKCNVDHLLLATGYRIDVARYPFLSAGILRDLATRNGYPVLKRGFESSVPGLHFIGAPAAYSFGPLLRFVSGTRFVGHSLAEFIRQSRPGS